MDILSSIMGAILGLIFIAVCITFVAIVLKALNCLFIVSNLKFETIKNKLNRLSEGEYILERKCVVYGILVGLSFRVYQTDTSINYIFNKYRELFDGSQKNDPKINDLGLILLCDDKNVVGTIKAYNPKTNLFLVVFDKPVHVSMGTYNVGVPNAYVPYDCLFLKWFVVFNS